MSLFSSHKVTYYFYSLSIIPQKNVFTRLVKQKRSGTAPFRFELECGEEALRLRLPFRLDDHFVSASSIKGNSPRNLSKTAWHGLS